MDLSHDSSGRYGQQATVSGTAGQENQFSYGATNVELDSTSQKIVPHSGAVVRMKYTTKQGPPF